MNQLCISWPSFRPFAFMKARVVGEFSHWSFIASSPPMWTNLLGNSASTSANTSSRKRSVSGFGA